MTSVTLLVHVVSYDLHSDIFTVQCANLCNRNFRKVFVFLEDIYLPNFSTYVHSVPDFRIWTELFVLTNYMVHCVLCKV